ncbi:nitrous oxide reductase family maturation protein NosD [Curtobacterium pusillum]|uniref:right-handed parallel beta-helix repeat-containing protein n=1 Tax=Curtobacterium pusillum TaxID=69373 RepID=UPI0016438D62|nr:right-handed parallel beta-helix repeat-containing protein [Curtobacterium pusillum]
MADARGVATRRSVVLHAAASVPALVAWCGRPQSARTERQDAPPHTPHTACTAGSNDAGAADIQDVIEAAEAHDVVSVTRDWRREAPLVIDRPITLRFEGGSLTTDRDIDLVLVRASSVRIVGAVLTGSGSEHSGLGRGIHAVGTVERPVEDLEVTQAHIAHFAHDGVLLEHCVKFQVVDSRISDVGYSGVLMFSCTDGVVARNRIERVTQPAPYPNSYGIQAVRSTTAGLDRSPRSSRLLVSDNHVADVAHWEGIDTHGGESIAILRNRIERCRVGIAVVPSKDEDDASATKYAPIGCSIIDNTVVRSEPGPGSGIVVRGAGESVGSSAERATGIVLRNTVIGYGDGDRDGAILVYLTRNLVIAQNECRHGRRRGISLYHSNEALTLRGNVVSTLVQQGTATSVVVDVRATDNSATLIGNSHRPGSTGGPVYGLMCRQTGNDLFLVDNDWSGTAVAVVAAPGVVVRHRE